MILSIIRNKDHFKVIIQMEHTGLPSPTQCHVTTLTFKLMLQKLDTEYFSKVIYAENAGSILKSIER